MPDPLNILWIITDEHRTDSLGCYGSRWCASPNIDGIARRGVTFANCTTQSPVCIPARASLLTGRYPHAFGTLENQWDELPDELRDRQTRLAKIEQAMAELEAEAKARADALRQARREKDAARKRAGKKRGGPKPKDPDDKPKPEAQRNFTDPESRIMKDGATKSFEQSYNCQAAVDETAH